MKHRPEPYWILGNSFRIKHDILRYIGSVEKEMILSQQACLKIDQDFKFTSNKNSHFLFFKKIDALIVNFHRRTKDFEKNPFKEFSKFCIVSFVKMSVD